MAELVTDPEILKKLNASSKGELVTDPETLAKLNKPEAPVTWAGLGKQVAAGLPRGALETTLLPARGLNWLTQTFAGDTEFAKERQAWMERTDKTIHDLGLSPEPENAAERYAGAIASGVGGAALAAPSVLASVARGAEAAGATISPALRGLAPSSATGQLALLGASGAGGGMAGQAAADAGLPVPMQIGASLAGGFLAPGAMIAAAPALSRLGLDVRGTGRLPG